MSDSSDPILIKRYPNRKLYNTAESKYVNLTEIAQMVEDGVVVTIIDNKTGEDMTVQMLAQIMVEREKRSRRPSSDFLHRMLALGSEPIQDIVDKIGIAQGKDFVEHAREDLEKQIHKWVDKGQVTRDEIGHYFDSIQKNIEEIGQSTEQTVSSIWDRILPKNDGQAQQQILKKLEILEKRMDVLEDKISRMK